MRDRTPSFLLPAACTGVLACALLATAPVRADDLFGPEPAKPAPGPVLQCPAEAAKGVDVQSRIAEIQRLISAKTAGAPGTNGVLLNNAGYNYGGGSREVDQAALDFEATQHAR